MAARPKNGHQYLSVKDLEDVLDTCKLELTQIDEVWPNLYIGNVTIAQNRTALQKLADDSTHFDLNIYFRPAADFIHKALKQSDGKVLVHCIMGMSRSSTLVLAYLMLYHQLPLYNAIQEVIKKRAIYPNRNFLALLLDLDLQLNRKRRTCLLL
ncbi:hypothetical protein MATL_G00018300 [Megalops atlanticus]|uniref:Protein-serine/threonine phosphatase n=1 Tax=Megalops atlanticus TaxID=7932 RepID=A0A9D3QM73_MEGAT|nr:hypothetical protein MATL_G00018300 [Megalops atlanticus]